MSPLRMFHACGSSSTCQRRSTRPTAVRRESPGRAGTGPVPDSARDRMVRNFTIPNTFPPRPSRGWRYSAGPGESSRTATGTASASSSHSGSSPTNASASTARSNGRL